MDDREMTKLCAQAMGLKPSKTETTEGRWLHGNEWIEYDPLHDDAQAMALVKRCGLSITKFEADEGWHVLCAWESTRTIKNADLNRAIVQAVAKMQQSRADAPMKE